MFDDGVGSALGHWDGISRMLRAGGTYYEPKYFGDGLAIAVSKRSRSEARSIKLSNGFAGSYEELVLRYFLALSDRRGSEQIAVDELPGASR